MRHRRADDRPLNRFYWPWRTPAVLRALPPREVRRYAARLERWCDPKVVLAWLAVGWMVGVGWVAWSAVGGRTLAVLVLFGAVVTSATIVSAVHVQTRRLIWVVLQDYPHLCRHCGYDLRGTPERCPECGATAAVS